MSTAAGLGRRWSLLGAGFVVACAIVIVPGPGGPVSADARPAETRPAETRTLVGGELTIAAQTFTLAAEGSFDVTLVLPTDVDAAGFDAGSVLVVTSHRAIADRFGFHQAVDGELTRTEDTFDISLDPAVLDPNLLAVDGRTLLVRVPTEALTRTPAALQLGQAGVHPIVFELRVRNRAAGEVTTYVNRLASTPSTAGDLSVALVMRETTQPVIGTDGVISVSTDANAELSRLADTLTAMDAAAAEAAAAGITDAAVPRGVLLEPSVLFDIATTDTELAAELLPGLERSVMIAAPKLPLDASAAVEAQLQTTYAEWLREGEDLLRSVLPTTPTDRSVFVVDDAIDDGGASMQRNLGVQLLVLPYRFYDGLDGSLRGLTDISQLVTVELADGSMVPAAIVDEFFARQMREGADDPVLGAIEIAAELVVLAGDIDDDGLIVDRHSVLLGLSDLGVPDAELMAELTPLLLSTPGLQLVEPGDLSTTTTTLLNDGRLVTVTLPDASGPDLAPRLVRISEISTEVMAYASMLPETSPVVTRWSSTIAAFPSTAMSDNDVTAAVARIEDEFAEFRAGIGAPEPFGFTLTGPDSKLRFSITNTTDTQLTVRVRLSSPKIRFPDGDQTLVLPPQSEVDVVTRAEALSNGKSSVFLRIYTPGGDGDVALVPEVVLTARVNSLAGVGQLVTGAGLLLVITWWAHHMRSNRRKHQSAKHQSRHPASAASRAEAGTSATPAGPTDPGDPGDPGDGATVWPVGREVSPDAAASSLPPS